MREYQRQLVADRPVTEFFVQIRYHAHGRVRQLPDEDAVTSRHPLHQYIDQAFAGFDRGNAVTVARQAVIGVPVRVITDGLIINDHASVSDDQQLAREFRAIRFVDGEGQVAQVQVVHGGFKIHFVQCPGQAQRAGPRGGPAVFVRRALCGGGINAVYNLLNVTFFDDIFELRGLLYRIKA